MSVTFEQIAAFECAKAEIRVLKVLCIVDCGLQYCMMCLDERVHVVGNQRRGRLRLRTNVLVQLLDHVQEEFVGLLVKIRHGNACCQFAIVNVLRAQIGSL